jgi:RNA polymerase sigma-70 factor (ECF subfamily)
MKEHFEHPTGEAPYQDLPDQMLADLVHEGDDNAFAELWDRHSKIAAQAGYYDAPQDAEDNAQDVAIKLWLDLRKGREFKTETARSFVGRMAVNNVRDNYRKRRCRPAEWLVGEYGDESEHVAGGPSPEDIVVGETTVREFLSMMTPDQRAAVQATVIDGSRYAEHAEDASIPLGTVKSRVHNGVTKVRTAFLQD